jgi:hypothetical protein
MDVRNAELAFTRAKTDLMHIVRATAVSGLADLPGSPCFHPRTPLSNPSLKGGDRNWPNAAPNLDNTPKDAPQYLQIPVPPAPQEPTSPAVFTGVHAKAEDAPSSHRPP